MGFDYSKLGPHAKLAGSSLSYANLEGMDLRGIDLGRSVLKQDRYFIVTEWVDTDLSHSRMRGANLQEANLEFANLSGADLRGADLSRVTARGANFKDSLLNRAILAGSDLEHACFVSTDLTEVNLTNANLAYADLTGSLINIEDLEGVRIEGARLSKMTLENIDFRTLQHDLNRANFGDGLCVDESSLDGSIFSDIKFKKRFGSFGCFTGRSSSFKNAIFDGIQVFHGGHFEGACFQNASLRNVNFGGYHQDRHSRKDWDSGDDYGSIFVGADLRGADLRNSIFEYANFRDANLEGANLEGSNLSNAIFLGANLVNARLKGAKVSGSRKFHGAIMPNSSIFKNNDSGKEWTISNFL